MNYQEARAYIQEIQEGAKIKPGLDTIRILLAYLGNPQERVSIVHVAGTNGKGSTAAFVEAVLVETGKKVGRFVSPAVFEERESIRYTEKNQTYYISEEEFVDYTLEIRNAIERMKKNGERIPTEFEIETAMAFLAFDQWDCDIVLVEAGMGGRLDSTNVVRKPVCVVITPVALDHTKFLGDTIEQIAMEKAGIIKEGVPVVSCQDDEAVKGCLREVCKEKQTSLRFVEKEGIQCQVTSVDGSVFSYGVYENLQISMAGQYQMENACLALECLQELKNKYPITDEAIRCGFEKAQWKGRFQKLDSEPAIILDGAHNPDGMQAFCESALTYYPDKKRIGVMGVFADKAYPEMCQQVAEVLDSVYTVTPPSERGLPAVKLAECLFEQGVTTRACDTIKQAVEQAREEAKIEGGVVFVLGSLSLLKEVCKHFT